MRLFDSFSSAGFHTCIATTFSLDFEAYELVALSRLRDAGCTNNVLVADSRMLGLALADERRRPMFAGRRYSVVGARPAGVFHPKLVLQLGKNAGRLLVASANMTSAGLAGNLEIVGSVEVKGDELECAPLLRSAVDYLAGLMPEGSIARRQLDWAFQRTPWLPKEAANGQPVSLPSGERLALLLTDASHSILERFLELVGTREVKRLVVVSPYWDADLRTVQQLEGKLHPQETKLLIRKESLLFPVDALGSTSAVVHDVTCVPMGAGRFPHAKLLIAESPQGDCVLFGSANCTEAALGLPAALNEEACLYRELPPETAVPALRLEAALEQRIPTNEIEPFVAGEEIPLDELAARLPGRFELVGQTLKWWSSTPFVPEESEVTLFGSDGQGIRLEPTGSTQSTWPVTYVLAANFVPHFAQVRAGHYVSCYAIVAVQQSIHQAQRKAANKAASAALKVLDEEGGEEGLWLLEVIQKLHDAERPAQRDSAEGAGHHRSKVKEADEQSAYLSYEDFVSGRSASPGSPAVGTSHLADTLNESVRSAINAVLSGQRLAVDDADDLAAPSLGMGDDPDPTSNHPGEPEETAEVAGATSRPPGTTTPKTARQRLYDTQKDLFKAVNGFLDNLRARVDSEPLGVVDLLRLRALLVVLLGAGTSKTELAVLGDGGKRSSRQVLPCDGEFGWPRLIGRVLFEFFRAHPGASKPLIRALKLKPTESEGLPVDLLECWATCYWALCAIRLGPGRRGPASSSVSEQALAVDLYQFTRAFGLPELEVEVESQFALLGARYAERLGISPDAIVREHGVLAGVNA